MCKAIFYFTRRKPSLNTGSAFPTGTNDSSGPSDDAGEEYALLEDESEREPARQARKTNNAKSAMYWRVEARGLIDGVLNLSRYSVPICTSLSGCW